MGEQCGKCRFFLYAAGDAAGWCRRLPAQWTNDARGWEFPSMKSEGWCGEFVPVQRH